MLTSADAHAAPDNCPDELTTPLTDLQVEWIRQACYEIESSLPTRVVSSGRSDSRMSGSRNERSQKKTQKKSLAACCVWETE